MTGKRTIISLIAAPVVAALALTGCGGGGGDDPPDNSAEQTQIATNAAARPEWFPAAFPLPARTEVVSQTADGAGGGTVLFRAPVGYLRSVQAIDLNMESHGFTVSSKTEDGEVADYVFESQRFTGTLKVTGQGADESTLDVTLVEK